MPVLSTGNDVLDKAFAIAMDDIAVNVAENEKEGLLKEAGPVLRAGLDYGFWIRDAAINAWNGSGPIPSC